MLSTAHHREGQTHHWSDYNWFTSWNDYMRVLSLNLTRTVSPAGTIIEFVNGGRTATSNSY